MRPSTDVNPPVFDDFSDTQECFASFARFFTTSLAAGHAAGMGHLRFMRYADGIDVKNVASRLAIKQDHIVLTRKKASDSSWAAIGPYDLVPELLPAENGIQEQLQEVTGGGVTVQVDRSRRLEDAMHLHESQSHIDQIGLHRLTMRHARRFDDGIGGRMLIGEFAVLVDVDILEGPGVLKGGAGGLAVAGCLVGAIRVEGRVEIDQVHAVAVHAAHDEKIIFRPDGTTGKVTPIST